MSNWQIFPCIVRNSRDLQDAKPTDIDIVDLLTRQDKGSIVHLLIDKPRNKLEKGFVEKGGIINEDLFINYGPHGYYYKVFFFDPLEKEVYFMDNTLTDKTFYLLGKTVNYPGVGYDIDKIGGNFYTVKGEFNEIFNYIKSQGFIFEREHSGNLFELCQEWDREKRIKDLFLKYNIYHCNYNPNLNAR